jgi:hypothetical protein
MFKLNIADIVIQVDSDNSDLINKFKLFYSLCEETPQLKVHLDRCEYINKPDGKIEIDESVKWLSNYFDKNSFSAYIYKEEINQYISMLHVDNKWSNAYASCLSESIYNQYGFIGYIGEILFRNCIIHHQGIVMHAAAIDWQGKGIMFSAPSGTGKSTQANLWKKYKGAKVLNADRPAVRVVNELTYVYGTPWSGATPEFLNEHAPLSAIVLLEQSTENSINLLGKQEAIFKLMPRCFLPYFNSELMDMAIKNLEKIIDSTPVYLLKCRPDREAVELVYQCVK